MDKFVIDKLEVRVPADSRFTPKFDALLLSTWDNSFARSRHYQGVADLRRLDCQAILHFKARQTHDHKLELIDTGIASYRELIARMEQVFVIDALDLEVMRVDLAADVLDVPVHAFVDNARAKYKRSSQDLGRYSRFGKLGVETYYIGKRPNLFRFYNKIAELRTQYAKLKRSAAGTPPPFEEVFGYPAVGVVLTRAERQIAGGRVPAQIATVGQLVNLPQFDPFDSLEILVGSGCEPNSETLGFSTYLQALGFRELVRHHGVQNARRLINNLSEGNAARYFKNFSQFLPQPEITLTEKTLFECYRQSVLRQLTA